MFSSLCLVVPSQFYSAPLEKNPSKHRAPAARNLNSFFRILIHCDTFGKLEATLRIAWLVSEEFTYSYTLSSKFE